MSEEGKTWSVRSAGGLIEGFDQETVVKKFAEAFKVPEEKAIPYISKSKLIRKGLNEVEATNYKSQLEAIGLRVSIQDQSAATETVAKAPVNAAIPGLIPTDQETSTGQKIQTHPSMSVAAHAFTCPKCMLGQEKSDQCSGCGIIFEKLNQRIESTRDRRETHRAAATSSGKVIDNDDEFPFMAIGAATVAALVFAFIWKFVAIQFDRELGVIAWGMGGAIGGAAAVLGGRGQLMGGLCACLVVGSIFLGKYMFASSYMDEAIAYMEMAADGDWYDVVYDEIASERDAYAAISKDDNSIKRFMIENDYTDATKVALVPPDDFAYFKEDIVPWLETPNESESYAEDDETPPDFAAAMGEITPWSIVKQSLGLLDIVFILLGVSTAYRLAQAGYES